MSVSERKYSLVDQFITGDRIYYSVTGFDIYVLSYQGNYLPDVDTAINSVGRVISVQSSGGLVGYGIDRSNYAFAATGDDTRITISGNYSGYTVSPQTVDHYYTSGDTWASNNDVSRTNVELDTNYNAYVYAFNAWNGSGSSDPIGAILLSGDNNRLMLTAQAGAEYTKYNWTGLAYTENAGWKTDDNIKLRSDAFAVYTPWRYDDSSGTVDTPPYSSYTNETTSADDAPLFWGQGGEILPTTQTLSYTIHSTGDELTVVSDLVGKIEANVGAVRTGYVSKGDKENVSQNNSSNINVKGAGVKVDGTLVLIGNQRANIQVNNNHETLYSNTAAVAEGNKVYLYAWDYVKPPQGDAYYKILCEEDAEHNYTVQSFDLSAYGTVIAGFASATADNNVVSNYGVNSRDIVMENGVWSGQITVDTSDVAIIANGDWLRAEHSTGLTASAQNNEIGAYGIYAENNITIAKMGKLVKDYNGINNDTKYASGADQHDIKTSVTNTLFDLKTAGRATDNDVIPGHIKATNNKIISVAVYANENVNIGEITDGFSLYSELRENSVSLYLGTPDSAKNRNTYDYSLGYVAAGFIAQRVDIGKFNGNITVVTDVLDSETNLSGLKSGSDSAGTMVYGFKADSLTSSHNFGGNINLNALGAAGSAFDVATISVQGVIDTNIEATLRQFGLYATELVADGFTGTIAASNWAGGPAVGLNIRSRLASAIAGDSFDMAGNITVSDFGITTLGALDLRVSGGISAGTAIKAERYVDYKTGIVGEKFDDKVDIAGTARITGDIDLGMLVNNVSINSNAQVTGIIKTQGGSLNLSFVLDGTAADTPVYTVRGYDTADALLKDSNTLTVNLAYAEAGTYTLIRYNFETVSAGGTIADYINGSDTIKFDYLGVIYELKIGEEREIVDNVTVSSELVARNNGYELEVTVTGDIRNPNALNLTANDSDFVSVTRNNSGVITGLDWSQLHHYLTEHIQSPLTSIEKYGIDMLNAYELTYCFVDDDDQVIAGSERTLEFHDLHGTQYSFVENGVEVAPDARDVRWSLTPKKDSIEDLANIAEIQDSMDLERNDAGDMVLDWSDLHTELEACTAEDPHDYIKSALEFDYYEVAYTLYSGNGDVVSTASQFFDRTEDRTDYTIEGSADYRVEWSIKLHTLTNAEVNNADFVVSNNNTQTLTNYYYSDYDVEAGQLTLDWSELAEQLSIGEGEDNYNFANTTPDKYEIEYILVDKDGYALNHSNSTVRTKLINNGTLNTNEIAQTATIMTYQTDTDYTFNGLDEGMSIVWRMRIVGNSTGSMVSGWSDWQKVKAEVNPPAAFDFTGFYTDVRDVSKNEAGFAIRHAVTELTWDGLKSDKAVRCYEVQYIIQSDQVTLQMAKDAGFDTVEDYVTSDAFFARTGVNAFSKVVTGNALTISNLKSAGFCYWRIRALDETASLNTALEQVENMTWNDANQNNRVDDNELWIDADSDDIKDADEAAGTTSGNGVSDWFMGDTFRVMTADDTTAPTFENKTNSFVSSALPKSSDGNTDVTGFLAWQPADDRNESGVNRYEVEIFSDGLNINALPEVFRTTEQGVGRNIAIWGTGLAADAKYTVTIGTMVDGNFVADTREVTTDGVTTMENVTLMTAIKNGQLYFSAAGELRLAEKYVQIRNGNTLVGVYSAADGDFNCYSYDYQEVLHADNTNTIASARIITTGDYLIDTSRVNDEFFVSAVDNADIDPEDYNVAAKLEDGRVVLYITYKGDGDTGFGSDLTITYRGYSNTERDYVGNGNQIILEATDFINADGTSRYTTYGYYVDFSKMDLFIDPELAYQYKITAKDFNDQKTSITGNIVVDNAEGYFAETDPAQNIGYWTDVTTPDMVGAPGFLTGYIGWNRANDAQSGIRKYVVSLVDSNGNVITDKDGRACTDVVDVTLDQTTPAITDRSIVTWTHADLQVDKEYTVTKADGTRLDAVAKEVDGVVKLFITGTGNLIDETLTVSLDEQTDEDISVTADNCKYYEFSINLDQWQLDSRPGDVVGSYNVKLEAVDYHKQTTTTNTQDLVATVDGSNPEFTNDGAHGYVVDVNYHGGDQPSTDISGTIAWAKATDDDSEIAYYTVTLKDSNGTPVREVIIDHTVTDYADTQSVIKWYSEELVADANYTVTVGTGDAAIGVQGTVEVDDYGHKYLTASVDGFNNAKVQATTVTGNLLRTGAGLFTYGRHADQGFYIEYSSPDLITTNPNSYVLYNNDGTPVADTDIRERDCFERDGDWILRFYTTRQYEAGDIQSIAGEFAVGNIQTLGDDQYSCTYYEATSPKHIVTLRGDFIAGDSYTVSNIAAPVVAKQDATGAYLQFADDNYTDGTTYAVTGFTDTITQSVASYDYSIDFSDWGLYADNPNMQGYTYEISATDRLGNTGVIANSALVLTVDDEQGPYFVADSIGDYVYYTKPASLTNVNTSVDGYVVWQKARDNHSPVVNYQVELGYYEVNPDTQASEWIPLGTSGNIAAADYTQRSVITLTEGDLRPILGDNNFVLDADSDSLFAISGGAGLDFIVKEVGDVKKLIITGEDNLIGQTILINGQGYTVTAENCTVYDYSLDISQLANNATLTRDTYVVKIQAWDAMGNESVVNEYTINADDRSPLFNGSNSRNCDAIVQSSAPEHLGGASFVTGIIGWNKAVDDDSEIYRYDLKITGEDGERTITLEYTEASAEHDTSSDTTKYKGEYVGTDITAGVEYKIHMGNTLIATVTAIAVGGNSGGGNEPGGTNTNTSAVLRWESQTSFTGAVTIKDSVSGATIKNNMFAGRDFNYTISQEINLGEYEQDGTTIGRYRNGAIIVGQEYTLNIAGYSEGPVTAVGKSDNDGNYIEWSVGGNYANAAVRVFIGNEEQTNFGNINPENSGRCNYFEFIYDLDELGLTGKRYNYSITAQDYFQKSVATSGEFTVEYGSAPEFKDFGTTGVQVDHSIGYKWVAAQGTEGAEGYVAAHAELAGYIGWEYAADKEGGIRNYVLTLKEGENVVEEAIIAINGYGENADNIVGRYVNNNMVVGEIYTVYFVDTDDRYEAVARQNGADGDIYLEWSYNGTNVHSGNMTVSGIAVQTDPGTGYKETKLETVAPMVIGEYRPTEQTDLVVGELYTIEYQNGDNTIATVQAYARKDSKGVYLNWSVEPDTVESADSFVIVERLDDDTEATIPEGEITYNVMQYAFDLSQWNLTGTNYSYTITAVDYHGNSTAISGDNIVAEDGKSAYFQNGEKDLAGFAIANTPASLVDAPELSGYLCWKRAVDDYNQIQRYEVTLLDANGNVIMVDKEGNVVTEGGTALTRTIDLGTEPGVNARPAGDVRYIGQIILNNVDIANVDQNFTINFTDITDADTIVKARIVTVGNEKKLALDFISDKASLQINDVSVTMGDADQIAAGNIASYSCSMYDYSVDFSDVWNQFDFVNNTYKFKVTAYDYYGNALDSATTNNFTGDSLAAPFVQDQLYKESDALADNPNLYVNAHVKIDSATYVDDIKNDPSPVKPTLTGFIGWEKAFDSESGILKYVVEVMDAAGNVVGSKTVDLSTRRNDTEAQQAIINDNSIIDDGAATARSIVLYTSDNLIVGNTYTVTVNGSDVISVVAQKTKVKETIDGKDVMVEKTCLNFIYNDVVESVVLDTDITGSCTIVNYDYTVSVDDWNLTGSAYTYKVTAYDYYGKATASNTYDLIADGKVAKDPFFYTNNNNSVSEHDFEFSGSQEDGTATLPDADNEKFVNVVRGTGDVVGSAVPAQFVRGDITTENGKEVSTATYLDGDITWVAAADNEIGIRYYEMHFSSGTLKVQTTSTSTGSGNDQKTTYINRIYVDNYDATRNYSLTLGGKVLTASDYTVAKDSNGTYFQLNETSQSYSGQSAELSEVLYLDKDGVNTKNTITLSLNSQAYSPNEAYKLVVNGVTMTNVAITAGEADSNGIFKLSCVVYSKDALNTDNVQILDGDNEVISKDETIVSDTTTDLLTIDNLYKYDISLTLDADDYDPNASYETVRIGDETVYVKLTKSEATNGSVTLSGSFYSDTENLGPADIQFAGYDDATSVTSQVWGSYTLDLGELENKLTNPSYNYKVYAVDMFGNRSDLLGSKVQVRKEDGSYIWQDTGYTGSFTVDKLNPEFKNGKVTEAVGFTPTEGGSSYSAVLGWNNATDDLGIHAYRIVLTDKAGKTIEKRVLRENTVAAENLGAVNGLAVWSSDKLVAGEWYRVTFADGTEPVYVQAKESSAEVNFGVEDGTLQDGVREQEIVGVRFISWRGRNLTGSTAETIEHIGAGDPPVLTTIAANISGTTDKSLTTTHYQYYNYTNCYEISGLVNGEYSYQIYAEDYFGKESAAITGTLIYDNIAPEFIGTTHNVTWSADANNNIVPVFSWSAAADDDGGVGMKEYKIFYRNEEGKLVELATINHDPATKVYTYTHAAGLPADTYEYVIRAYDNIGNSTALTGNFGSSDTDAPNAAFSNHKSTVEIIKALDNQSSARVELSWDYAGKDAAYYRVVINAGSKSYEFWTTKDELTSTGGKMVFDNTMPGRPVDIFAGLTSFTWTVDAADASYNIALTSTSTPQVCSIETTIVAATAPKPYDIKLVHSKQINDANTDEVSLSWVSGSEKLGTYYYTITLQRVDEDGEAYTADYDAYGQPYKFTGNTLFVNSKDFLPADMDPKAVTTRTSGNYTTLTIADLRKFFGVTNLPDGDYKVTVVAHGANDENGIASDAVSVKIDTVRPGSVNVTNAKAIAVNLSETIQQHELVIEWSEVDDASGIDYYIVEYRAAGSSAWASQNVANVAGSNQIFSTRVNDLANAKTIEYRITAVDKSGNKGQPWSEFKTIEIVSDGFMDTLSSASDKTADFNTNGVYSITGEAVGRGDTADTFKIVTTAAQSITLAASNFAQVTGTNPYITINVYEGKDHTLIGSLFTQDGGGWTMAPGYDERLIENAGNMELSLLAGTSYVFEVVNNDPTGTSASKYDLTVRQVEDSIVDAPWFNAEKFTASVSDTNGDSVAGVITDSATFKWSGLEGGANMGVSNTPKYYEIEYWVLDNQLTTAQLGDLSIEEYVINLDSTTATGTITTSADATSIDYGFANTGYVYWRIRGVMEDNPETTTVNEALVSNWIAGEHFYFGDAADTVKPDIAKMAHAFMGIVADKPVDVGEVDTAEATTLSGKIMWNGAATDDKSGIKEYRIEISTNGGKSYNSWKTVGAESIVAEQSRVVYTNNQLDAGKTYVIYVAGDIYRGKVQVNGTTKTLVWDSSVTDNGNLSSGNWIGENAAIYELNGETETLKWNVSLNNSNCTVYNYSADFDDWSGAAYNYRIAAVDYSGNISDWVYGNEFVVDKGAPVFMDETVTATVTNNADRNAINATISWNKAVDFTGDEGVRYYEVQVKASGETNWTTMQVVKETGAASYTAALNGLQPGDYELQIVACDYFGNKAVISGSFGTPDSIPPVGNFTKFNPTVDANYKTVTWTEKVEDEETGKEVEVTKSADVLVDAKVVLDWSDTFTDAVHYKVVISDNENLNSATGKYYEFWTTAEEAQNTQMVFDHTSTGRPVGVFEGIHKVYVRVFAYDANYNVAAASSGTQSFYFTRNGEENGTWITHSEGVAKPEDIKVKVSYADGCYNDNIEASWSTDNTLLGVYAYKVELLDMYYNTVATQNTLDLSDKLSTDVKQNKSFSITTGSSNTTVTIHDLKKFFGMTELNDGTYALRITAFDAFGKQVAQSSEPWSWGSRGAEAYSSQFVVDTHRPGMVEITEYLMIPSAVGDDNHTNALMISWNPVDDASGIDHYEIYYRVKGETDWHEPLIVPSYITSTFNLPKEQWIDFNIDLNNPDKECEFYVQAVDKQGNVGECPPDNYKSLKLVSDKYTNKLTAADELVFNENRGTVEDLVGLGDTADCFTITTPEATDAGGVALKLVVEDLYAVSGYNKAIRIDIYEGENTQWAWASYWVSDTGKVFSDLLLKADTTYTFAVSNTDWSQVSASQYKLVIDKTNLPVSIADDNWNTIDTVSDANFTMPVTDNSVASYHDWVGFGDNVDYRKLNLSASGKYTFTLKDVSSDTVMTIYQVAQDWQGNDYLQYVSSVYSGSWNVDGASTNELLLDNSKQYYVEVKAANGNAYGTDYTVIAKCNDAFPAPTANDDTVASAVPLTGQQSGWVGFNDVYDYYKVNVTQPNDGSKAEYSINLTGTNGNQISVSLGYIDQWGYFRTLQSAYGAYGSDSLSLAYHFQDWVLDAEKFEGKNDFYIQVAANGYQANSDYQINFVKNSDNTYSNNSDDRILTYWEDQYTDQDYTYTNLTPGNSQDEWVGMGDSTDYLKIDSNSGLYDITIDNVQNPMYVTLYQAVKDADNNVSYYAWLNGAYIDGNSKTAMFENMLLDANADYYIGVTSYGQNSNYTVSVSNPAGTEAARDITTLGSQDNGIIEDLNEEKHWSGSPEYYVYDASENGGAYKFSLSADKDFSGYANLTVYELLDNGGKRWVGGYSVSAGNSADTGYLYLADKAVSNGTGIYMVEIKGSWDQCYGDVTYSVTGYEFPQSLDANEATSISTGTPVNGWIGIIGDAEKHDNFDEYTFTTATGGVHTIDLSNYDGNKIWVAILDENGYIVKSYYPAYNSNEASFAYNFEANKEYKIKVSAGWYGCFSKYTIGVNQVADEVNSRDTLGDAKAEATAVTSSTGWVGLGNGSDYYKLSVNETGCYELNVTEITNDLQLLVYEVSAGAYGYTTTTKYSYIQSANNSGVMSLYLDNTKDYYVEVRALDAWGWSDTKYSWALNSMATIDTTNYTSTNTKVGYGNMVDYYQFTAINGATNFSIELTDELQNATCTLYKVNTAGYWEWTSSMSVSAWNKQAKTGALVLDAGAQYIVEITAPWIPQGTEVDYEFKVNGWVFDRSDAEFADNTMSGAVDLVVGTKVTGNMVWNVKGNADNADYTDFYKFVVSEAGSYTLDLTDINGNAISASIGLDYNGWYSASYSAWGQYGAEKLSLSCNLEAGTYYVRIDSTGWNTASMYDLELTRNNNRDGFSNEDDNWQKVAGNIDSLSYGHGDSIEDWVGFGDSVDVFKIRLDDLENVDNDNSKVRITTADTATIEALNNWELSLSLVDANGWYVGLNYIGDGVFETDRILSSDTDYYLSVNNNASWQKNIDYDFEIEAIKLA